MQESRSFAVIRMNLPAWNWASEFVLNLAVKQPDVEFFL